MDNLDSLAFASLFKAAFEKCFVQALQKPMSETESKRFSDKIFDDTGMVVGWKSLKNYSIFLLDQEASRPANPSPATLDSLARYLGDAPYSSETERMDAGGKFAYWFAFRENFARAPGKATLAILHADQSGDPSVASANASTTNRIEPDTQHMKHDDANMPAQAVASGKRLPERWLVIVALAIAALLITVLITHQGGSAVFTDHFDQLDEQTLIKNGWILKSPDNIYWKRRGDVPGKLTLYTLRGDNWPKPEEETIIHNLLLRKLNADCFDVEVQFSGFRPQQNWQQAGLILLEDSNLNGRALRVSVAYNDFFGGYARPGEVILQAITSRGQGYGEPEEIAHIPLLVPDSTKLHPLLLSNLAHSFLKIEKRGTRFRVLYAGGAMPNPAFREVISKNLDIQPAFVGLFAIRGFVDTIPEMAAHVDFFRLSRERCD